MLKSFTTEKTVARLTTLLTTLVLFGTTMCSASEGCMGIPGFLEWSGKETHPYRPTADRAKAIKKGYKALKLGMTLEQARSTMPQPDWAESDWKGCTWHFATRLDADGESEKSTTVRFGGNVINGLGHETFSVSK